MVFKDSAKQVIEGDAARPATASEPRELGASDGPGKARKAANTKSGTDMKLPAVFRKKSNNVVEDALFQVQSLEGQVRKLDGRLADAVVIVEKVDANRRQLLIEHDPTGPEFEKASAACRAAADNRAAIEDARRAVMEQFVEAQSNYARHVDHAARAAVISDCEARAKAIDAAAKRLTEAAHAFGDARLELVEAIAKHGVADGDTHVEHLATPIVKTAIRLAAPGILSMFDPFGAALERDPIIVARQVQSGRLRDHADDMKAGVLPVEAPARPNDSKPPIAIRIPERTIVVKHGLQFFGATGLPTIVSAGSASLPEPVAEAAIAAGMACNHGTPEAIELMQRLERDRRAVENGLDRKTGRPKVQDFPSYRRLDFDLSAWIAERRARTGAVATEAAE